MKKERNPIVVVLCMILLLAIIALPPTFRKLIPREEINSQKEEKNSIAVLKCNKTYEAEQYEEITSVKYINGKISTNRIVYKKIEAETGEENTSDENNNVTPEDNTTTPNVDSTTPIEGTTPMAEDNTNAAPDATTTPEEGATTGNENEESSSFQTVSEELLYFKSLVNINIKETESQTTILLNKKSLTENADDMKLMNYFQDKIKDQQDYYESVGYTCSILEG